MGGWVGWGGLFGWMGKHCLPMHLVRMHGWVGGWVGEKCTSMLAPEEPRRGRRRVGLLPFFFFCFFLLECRLLLPSLLPLAEARGDSCGEEVGEWVGGWVSLVHHTHSQGGLTPPFRLGPNCGGGSGSAVSASEALMARRSDMLPAACCGEWVGGWVGGVMMWQAWAGGGGERGAGNQAQRKAAGGPGPPGYCVDGACKGMGGWEDGGDGGRGACVGPEGVGVPCGYSLVFGDASTPPQPSLAAQARTTWPAPRPWGKGKGRRKGMGRVGRRRPATA